MKINLVKNKENRKQEERNEMYIALFEQEAELRYQYEKLLKETEEMRSQEAELRELHQNVRQLKHDMKNHLMVLTAYLNDGEYDLAKAYTSELLDKFSTMHSYIETGNVLLNHIINEKLSYAKSLGILVKAEIENLAFEKMNRMDFSSLLSNLLDNAIEALEREWKRAGAEESQEKQRMQPQLKVCITAQRGYETICVKNQIAASVLSENPELLTSKEEKEKHGLGVGKIKSVAEQYGGMVDFYEEDNFFCVKVFIPK